MALLTDLGGERLVMPALRAPRLLAPLVHHSGARELVDVPLPAAGAAALREDNGGSAGSSSSSFVSTRMRPIRKSSSMGSLPPRGRYE